MDGDDAEPALPPTVPFATRAVVDVLVLDTSTVAPGDRAEAFQSTVSSNCSSSLATFEDPSSLWADMHVVELGRTKVFTIDASGTVLRRTPKHSRAMDHCEVALALPMRTDNRMTWDREEQFFGPRDLILVDLSAPYEYGWRGSGASYAFHVDYADLGLPMDAVRVAAVRLRASPLYSLVRDHVVALTTQARRLEGSASAAHVGDGARELMRALIASVAGDDASAAETMHTSLEARVRAYVRAHLRSADLTPARIAAAHGISVRALYALYEQAGASLEQAIIRQRLAGARRDLARPELASTPIGDVARSWGFANPSFFAARFKAEFGVTPRQWRATPRPE